MSSTEDNRGLLIGRISQKETRLAEISARQKRSTFFAPARE